MSHGSLYRELVPCSSEEASGDEMSQEFLPVNQPNNATKSVSATALPGLTLAHVRHPQWENSSPGKRGEATGPVGALCPKTTQTGLPTVDEITQQQSALLKELQCTPKKQGSFMSPTL